MSVSVRPRYSKKTGELISYELRVFRGRDVDGKQLKPFTKTWTPEKGMTARQTKTELERQKVLFEEACKGGNISTERYTFAQYAEYTIDLKERNGRKLSTVDGYRRLMVRINDPALYGFGHLKLTEVQAIHLNRFYAKLAEPGTRYKRDCAKAKINIVAWLKRNNMSRNALAVSAGVAASSVSAVTCGHTIAMSTAEKIAAAMGRSVESTFTFEGASEPLAAKTIREYHGFISAVFAQAFKEGLVAINPAQRATPPSAPKHEASPLEPEDVGAILEALEDAPLKWKAITYLLIATGMRRGEVCGLMWDVIDWENKQITISRNLLYTPERGTYCTTPKTGESRRVFVADDALAVLKEWRLEQGRSFMEHGIEPSGYCFTAPDGKAMCPDTVTTWMRKFSEAHNLPHMNPHRFRHTQASFLIASGTDIVSVSKRLGHKDVSTTINIYAHSLAKFDQAAADTAGELFRLNKAAN